MDAKEIIALGYEMRRAQKLYFKTRTTTTLNKAKGLEKQFDTEVENFLHPNRQLCFEDFNTVPAPWLDIPLEPLN